MGMVAAVGLIAALDAVTSNLNLSFGLAFLASLLLAFVAHSAEEDARRRARDAAHLRDLHGGRHQPEGIPRRLDELMPLEVRPGEEAWQ
jgi:hypothetical protein